MKEEESFPRGRSSGTKPALRKVKDKVRIENTFELFLPVRLVKGGC